jgi:hypothetical protein
MVSLEMCQALLQELVMQKACCSLEVEIHHGVITQLHRAEPRKAEVPAYRPPHFETRASTSNPH